MPMIHLTRRVAIATCPFCHAGLLAGERACECAACGARHHLECFALQGGCAVHACRSQEAAEDMDDWTINPDDPVSIGDQITNRILYAIARSVYRPGDKLPTVRDVAARLRVNPNTVSKAYRDLERDGVLESRRGTGVFVNEGADKVALERRQAQVLARFERAAGEALDAGLEAHEIQEVLGLALDRAARARGREPLFALKLPHEHPPHGHAAHGHGPHGHHPGKHEAT